MFFGVILILLSSAAQNGSAVLLSVAARTRSDRSSGPSLVIGVAQHRQGMLGMVLNTVGWLFELVALTRITLTLDRIIMTAGFGLVLALGHWWLKEPIGWGEIIGVLAIAIGIIAVGVMPVGRSEQLPSVAGWLLMVVVLIPGVLVPTFLRFAGQRVGPVLCAGAAGLAYALTGVFTKGLADLLSFDHLLALLLLLLGVALVDTVGFTNQLFALQHESASVTVPIIAALRVLVPIILAPFFFNESWPPEAWKQMIMAGGILLNVLGVVILARSQAGILASGQTGQPIQVEGEKQPT